MLAVPGTYAPHREYKLCKVSSVIPFDLSHVFKYRLGIGMQFLVQIKLLYTGYHM